MESTLITPEAAREMILSGATLLSPRRVDIGAAAGQVLAEPLIAALDLPPFPNAAMDGFALRSADAGSAGTHLRVTGRVAAGAGATTAVGPGEALAIATGALIPEGADAVVPIERGLAAGDQVELLIPAAAGMNIRHQGEDVRCGELLAAAGTILGPGQLAAACAAGVSSVLVHPRPSAVVIPTGDEVVDPGRPLPAGHVYDAVSIPACGLLEDAGATATRWPVVADEPAAIEEAIRRAAAAHDVVVTVGGVSVGARDFVGNNPGLPEIRSVKLALRPARPFAFGRIGTALVLCLPGNPASALVAFEELVRPVVLALARRSPGGQPPVRALLTEALAGKPGRLWLVPCRVWLKDGRLLAGLAGRGAGGPIRALADANAWAVVPADCSELPAGAEVEVRFLSDVPDGDG